MARIGKNGRIILDKLEEITSKLGSEGSKLYILQKARERALQEEGIVCKGQQRKRAVLQDHETRLSWGRD